jgi:uncharacterized SAM-dependent methyltransferase
MRLRSAADQQVRLPGAGLTVGFAAGEEMRTEIAAKFRRDGVDRELVDRELAASGLKTRLVDRRSRPVRGLALGPGMSTR